MNITLNRETVDTVHTHTHTCNVIRDILNLNIERLGISED